MRLYLRPLFWVLFLKTLTSNATASDEKFIPPNLNESGRLGCYVEASDPHEGNAKVFVQFATGRLDYSAVIARRTDPKQLALDCSRWFRDIAEKMHGPS